MTEKELHAINALVNRAISKAWYALTFEMASLEPVPFCDHTTAEAQRYADIKMLRDAISALDVGWTLAMLLARQTIHHDA